MIRLFTSHLVVCSLNVLCRAWLLLKRRFASRASPKHPSEPWTVVVKTDRFTSGAQGRDLLEPLIHGPRGQTTSLQLDQLKTPLARRRIESGGAARHSALLLHSDSKDFT